MGYLDTQSKFQQREKVKMEWRPWLLWVAATGVGYMAGSYLVGLISLADPMVSDLLFAWVRTILGIAVTGAVVGLAQGLVLWKYMRVPIVRPWVLATLIGGVLGVGVIFLFIFARIPFIFCLPLPFIIPGALLGVSVGYAQRRVLGLYVDTPTLWVRLNVLAGILALASLYAGVFWAVSSFTVNSNGEIPNIQDIELIYLVIGWLPPFIYGAVTGREFLRIVHSYRAQGQREAS